MDISELARAVARPTITVIFAITIMCVVLGEVEVPTWFLVMANTVIIEWWGERLVTHIKEK